VKLVDVAAALTSRRRLISSLSAAAFLAAVPALPVRPAAASGQPWQERASSAPLLPNGYSPLPSLSGLVKELKPAVVNIYTTQVIKQAARPDVGDPFFDFFGHSPFGRNGPFERFFGGPRGDLRQNALGSGFFISPDGYLLTNHHVVAKASEIKVKLADERTFEAKLVGSDEKTDIALLKVETSEPLPFAYLGDSDKLEVGDWVIAIGNPFGLGHTVTAGIISGKDRQIGQGPYDDFLQTDASINPGNSGGPLFDSAGDVVGINTAIVAGGSGVGFAVPINLVKSLVTQLRDSGKVTRGWLGVGIQELTEELAKGIGVEPRSGVLVGQVFPGSPAEKAGIEAGDVIVSIDGKPVSDTRKLSTLVAGIAPGSEARVELLRDGSRKSLKVTLAERDSGEQSAISLSKGRAGEAELGLSLAPVTPESARQLGLEQSAKGLIVERVAPSSPAAGILRPGDVILEVNRKRVANLSDFSRALAAGRGERVLLRVQRGEVQVFVVVRR
jgi:serine protease Do